MSSTPSQHQAPRKRPNFEVNDSYVGLCGTIYITKKLYVVFHCYLCKEKYGQLKNYLRHISGHYANYSQWKDSTADTASDADHTKTPNTSEEDPLIEDATEDIEYLIEEVVEEIEDNAVELLAETAHEIEKTAELATNAVEESKGAEVKDVKFDDVIIVGRGEEKNHITEKDSHSERSAITCYRTLRKRQKISHANASPKKLRTPRLHTHSNSENTATDKDAKQPNDVVYERKFKCEICGFAFRKAFNLRVHIRRHKNQKHYCCTMCPKQFYTSNELTVHHRMHTGERPFTCEQCGLCFITGSQLSQHQRRHSNLRPYKCSQCDKSFYDRSLLKNHFVTHTKERNFICKICNASFNRRKALLTHIKLHANLKEYVCSICQQGFNQRPALNSHIKSKHKVVT